MRRGGGDYQQNRRSDGDRRFNDRGDRSRSGRGQGDRGGFRGGRGGPGGGQGGGPKNAQTRPGHEEVLLSNNFHITFNGADKAFIYTFNAGASMQKGWQKGAAYHNAREEIEKVYGKTARYRNGLLAFERIAETHNFNSFDNDGTQTEITISLNLEVDLNNISNSQHQEVLSSFVSSVCKDSLIKSEFKQIGRVPRFYDMSDPKQIPRHGLEVWPGYSINAEVYRAGFFFNIDAVTKFIQTQNVLETLTHLRHERKYTEDKIKDILLKRERRVPGFTVITKWHKQLSYQIDDIAFDLTPKTYKFLAKIKKDEPERMMSMEEYFREKFPETPIRANNQPLLVVHKREETIYLPPELCNIPNLPEDFTKNAMAMRDLQDFKSFDPTDRYTRICKMASKLSSDPDLNDQNLKVATEMISVKGRYLQDLTMKDPRNPQNRFKFYDYTKGSLEHSEPMKLGDEEWAIVYAARDYDLTNNFIQGMKRAQQRMGIRLGEPQYIELNHNSFNDYKEGFKEIGDVKMVVVLLFKESDKHALKAVLDTKVGIPSQFVLTKTAQKAERALAVAGNILKQMNAKLAQDLYRINFSNTQDTMVVGVNAINHGKGMLFSLVATYSANLSKCYTYIDKVELSKEFLGSQVSKDAQETETTKLRTAFMRKAMQEACDYYGKKNQRKPRQIIVYRDAIGGPSMTDKCFREEVPAIQASLDEFTGNMDTKLIYCFVNQKLNQRFFVKNNGNQINAGAGTVIDSQLVKTQGETEYDFYMVPHSATVATAMPVHFSVKYNDSNIDKEAFETLTYHLCYNYFNFGGGIKVPNVVKYAEKAANYANDIRGKPNKNLAGNLHFL